MIRSHQDSRLWPLLASLLLALVTACDETHDDPFGSTPGVPAEQRTENPYIEAGRRTFVELERGVQGIRRLESKEQTAGRVETPPCAPRLERLLDACVAKLGALDRASPAEWDCAWHEVQISLRRLDETLVEARKKHINEE